MVGSYAAGGGRGAAVAAVAEGKLDELRRRMGKADGDLLRIVGVGGGAWGSAFCALLQDAYGRHRDKAQVRVWRRPGRAVDRATAEHLFEVINSREDVLRRLIRRCAYLKYVEARLGDRTLYADEILRDGFCLNMVDTPLCPLKVVTNLQEAVWDADIVINGLPSTETREVFGEIGRYWKERIRPPVIISLAKGIEASIDPVPRIITPTQMISNATGVPLDNILYLGGPNIASEIYNKEYANARICGADKWRKPLAKFLRQPHFIVWDNSDLITHEVMGGLKNIYAIGAGMVAALTNESATSKSVYFSLCTSEMIYITHLLAEDPEKLAGPLLADTYVTLLKGRNAWYGQKLAKGELTLEMGDSIKGKGTIQGVSAVHAFYELLSQSSLSVTHPEVKKLVAPVELCPILKTLYKILIKRELATDSILQAIRDESMYDPRERIEMSQRQCLYRPSLLGLPKDSLMYSLHSGPQDPSLCAKCISCSNTDSILY
uniref:Glycerol-3-phosphate dehydrogenase [NAD(+)] n=1 Tax=Oryza rufipogon TaxID=4529 RepID=A0A0E0PPE8_ORYRU